MKKIVVISILIRQVMSKTKGNKNCNEYKCISVDLVSFLLFSSF